MLDWLSRLVSIDTTTRNTNLPLIDIVQEWLVKHQVQVRVTRDPKQPKANLFGTLPAKNGSLEGGLILSGHTDVVPVDGQTWKTNPFEAVKIGDKVFGRGTCDMKGFLAVVLSLVPEFKKIELKEPLHFAFSYDEEGGAFGIPYLIEDLKKAGIKPKGCIVGEPTNMQVVVGHKGFCTLHCAFHGHAAHSSLTPEGCNAIEYAAQFISYIRTVADQFAKDGPFDSNFDVSFSTMSTNTIQGGNAVNTVPALCEFIVDFRTLASVKQQAVIDKLEAYARQTVLPRMQKEVPSARIQIEPIARVPSFETTPNTPLEKLAREISGDCDIHKAAFATEAGLFEEAKIPTILCGPGRVEEAHRADEYVSIDQLQKCEAFLRKIVQKFCCL
jgi:acetylornithine deacetylase